MKAEIINQLVKNIESKKEELIKSRIKELGLDLSVFQDILKRKKIRFNPFVLEKHEGFGELLYYNDGSDNGLFVIGFTEMSFPEMSFENYGHKVTSSQSYFITEPDWANLYLR